MAKRGLVIAGVALIALGAAGYATRSMWSPDGAVAQAPRQGQARVVPVDVTTAVKKPMPVNLDALGTVMPIASVAIKARLETEIVGVHFVDGQEVKEGDLLFTLDGRALEAQVAQAEGMFAREQATLEGAERDLKRYTELIAKGATTQVNLDNARTQVNVSRAAMKATAGTLENLKVQLSYTRIRATIPGRISAANVKVGNFVRPADTAPLATINQIKPVYVTVAVPQKALPELKQAMTADSARVEAAVPGEPEPSIGKLAMVDNTVDPTTGMVMVRAIMQNRDQALWPGTLVNTTLTLRTEEAVAIPAVAVQTGQNGTYVFVVKDGAAKAQPVTVARSLGAEVVISQGLSGGETVVVDGQMLLADGTKVAPRAPKVGS